MSVLGTLEHTFYIRSCDLLSTVPYWYISTTGVTEDLLCIHAVVLLRMGFAAIIFFSWFMGMMLYKCSLKTFMLKVKMLQTQVKYKLCMGVQ